jgi:cysteinyl-tRNA synthetase
VDYSFDSMDEAERAQQRVYQTLAESRALLAGDFWHDTPFPAELAAEATQIEAAFAKALADDLNTASAIGHIFAFVRTARHVLENKTLRSSAGAREFFTVFLRSVETWRDILGLFGSDAHSFLQDLRAQQLVRKRIDASLVEALLEKRKTAREKKDFTASDVLRGELLALGIEVRDSPEGQVWDIAF